MCGNDDEACHATYNHLVCAFREGIDAVTPTDVFQLMHAMDGLLLGTSAAPPAPVSQSDSGANGEDRYANCSALPSCTCLPHLTRGAYWHRHSQRAASKFAEITGAPACGQLGQRRCAPLLGHSATGTRLTSRSRLLTNHRVLTGISCRRVCLHSWLNPRPRRSAWPWHTVYFARLMTCSSLARTTTLPLVSRCACCTYAVSVSPLPC